MIRATRLAVGVAVLIASAATAHAGGGGGHRSCHESSDVVGHHRCHTFGWWAFRPSSGLFEREGGLVFDHLTLPAFDQRGAVYDTNGTPSTSHTVLAPGASRKITTIGWRARVGYRGRLVTIGAEVSGTYAPSDTPTITDVGGNSVASSYSVSAFDFALVVGVHQRVLDNVSLGAELVGGVRSLSLYSSLPRGESLCPQTDCSVDILDTQYLLEVRARADWFLNPNLSLGVALGVDVAASGESLAFVVAYHLAAYDGT